MIHPHTRIQFINEDMGYGVFATGFIPKGTITYVKDSLELEITPNDFLQHTPQMQDQIEKYSYIDENGIRIVSWDFAKYVNHCCDCNTMSTGYGFEIAIRDIQPGEEITDEYGIFNMEQEMMLECKRPGCRGLVCSADLDRYYPKWDAALKEALHSFDFVEQPLVPFLDEQTIESLNDYLSGKKEYRSVYYLKHFKNVPTEAHVMNGIGNHLEV
jgi:hypothetical protein